MKKVIKRIFLGVFALMIFALGAGIISSYYFLEVSDYEFENEKIQESVKLVQLSDIHNAEFGKENQRLLKKLKECEPDLIFITGDLINSDENEISPMLDLVKKLRDEYYGAAEPPVRCGESHLSGLTEPPHFVY